MIIMKEVRSVQDMKDLLEEAGLTSPGRYIVKPNWFFQGEGFYSDAKTLKVLLEGLDKVTVVEAYTYVRNDGTRKITHENARNSWDWLREQDKRFLIESGLDSLFKEYDVEYVNVTEEVWSNRVVNHEDVKKLVEEKFPPVARKELYEQIPQRLYDLRGRKLISFAKVKGTHNRISGTLKNMFGLIIDPDRHNRWHGEKNRDLAQNIVDVNKVYSSLFETVGLFESMYTAVRYRDDGAHPLPWGGRYDLIQNLGLAVYGDNLAAVDAYVCKLCGIKPERVKHIRLAAEVFGKWPQEIIEEASKRQLITL